MSRGTIALIGGLFVASLLVIVVISLVVTFAGALTEHEATRDVDFVELLWLSLLRTLDPGTMGGDRGSITFVLSMLAVTLGGIFIISTLIGIIGSGIQTKLAEMRKGRSRVLESGHTVILGWSSEIFSVIGQIVLANANKRGQRIVVLADRDKVQMEDEIRQRVPDTGSTRIVCRSGSPIDLTDLDICSPQTSRSILVLSPDNDDPDADVIKTLLAITNSPKRRTEPYHIVAEIEDPSNVEVARLAGHGEAHLVLGGELIGRIAAQACRQPGLSVVYMELLDFRGAELYFSDQPELAGRTFGDALHLFRDSSLVGISPQGGSSLLNPPMDRVVQPGERLIFIARDDDAIEPSDPPSGMPDEERVSLPPVRQTQPERTLVLGWNRRTPGLLLELDRYVAAGSRLTVAADGPQIADEVPAVGRKLHNLAMTFEGVDTSDRSVLERLVAERPDHIVIMSYADTLDEQRADARTLVSLLHLRDISSRTGMRWSIVSEMLDVRNRSLAKATRSDDFIVSGKLVSLTMSQLAENPALQPVFDDLFDVEGAEIYLKPATDYVTLDGPVDFHTVVEGGRQRGEVCFGYRLMALADDPDSGYGVVINPDKQASIQLTEEDRIIVLAHD